MTGGVALKGPGVATVLMRQRVTVVPRCTRSISSVRTQRLPVPGRRGQLNPILSGRIPWRAASVAVDPASMRFNSTLPNAPTDVGAPPATAEGGFPDISDPLLTDLPAIPEKIGYLKELGLDYGIGPSSLMQYVIEHMHMWTGLPWWASIVATGILVRVALLKPVLMASDASAKIHNIQGVVKPLRQEQVAAAQNNDRMTLARKKAELQQVYAEHGIDNWKPFLPMVQIPLGYGCFRVVRGMAQLPVPGLANESAAWLTDLTVADPLFIIPALNGLVLYLTFKKGGESGSMELFKTSAGKGILYGLPALSFAFMAFFPSALQLYFLSTGLLGLGQAYLLHSPRFREYMNMTIMNKVSKGRSGPINTDLGHSKGLRLLYERIEAERAKAAELTKTNPANGPQNQNPRNSWIDRMLGATKNYGRQVSEETREKFRQLQGVQTKNADGSPAAQSRLTDEQRRHAERYERQRKEEEEYKRAERNHARKLAHKQALQAEKEKAKKSLAQFQPQAKQKQDARR